MATPAAPTISAVADAASAARVLSHVQLAGSCSATVHARCLVAPVALSAGQGYLVAYKRRCLAQPSAGGLSSVLVTPPTTVLLGSFVGGTVRASVSRRARGSASQGRGIVAPALLFALIHPSAWNRYSRKFTCRILHNHTLVPYEITPLDIPHSPTPLQLVTPMDRYARWWMPSCCKLMFVLCRECPMSRPST